MSLMALANKNAIIILFLIVLDYLLNLFQIQLHKLFLFFLFLLFDKQEISLNKSIIHRTFSKILMKGLFRNPQSRFCLEISSWRDSYCSSSWPCQSRHRAWQLK